MLKIECYSFSQITKGTWSDWQRCYIEWKLLPTQLPICLKAVVEAENTDTGQLFLFIAKSDDRYVGFFPFRTERRLLGRLLPITYCCPWTTWCPPWLCTDPLLDTSFTQQVVERFYKKIPYWNKLITGLVNRNATSHQEQQILFINNKFTVSEEKIEMAEIRNSDSFDDFLQKLSKKWSRNYRRVSRKLYGSYNTKLIHITEFKHNQELESVISRIMRIYKESWKVNDTDPVNNLMMPIPYKTFCSVIKNYAERNGLHALFLTINGEDAAFSIGIHQSGIYSSLHTAYKEKFKNLSAGYFAMMENFRFTIENGFCKNNLLDNQAYKQHLTNQVENFSIFVAHNNNFLGRFASKLTSLFSTFKSFGKRKH